MTEQALPDTTLSTKLAAFFTAYQEIQAACDRVKTSKPSLFDGLQQFFADFSGCCASAPSTISVEKKPIDAAALADLFTALEQPLQEARAAAFFFNPWDVAGLGRDEVRNTGVLAWMLDPNGSHGLRGILLDGLLVAINQANQRITTGPLMLQPGAFCRVRTEINPNGEVGDRVDIEIDARDFYLIIEVKVDAPEQPGQLERYCKQAESVARQRPWQVIFLTPKGRPPVSAGVYAETNQILPLSWRGLARHMNEQVLNGLRGEWQLHSGSHQITAHAVKQFLSVMNSF